MCGALGRGISAVEVRCIGEVAMIPASGRGGRDVSEGRGRQRIGANQNAARPLSARVSYLHVLNMIGARMFCCFTKPLTTFERCHITVVMKMQMPNGIARESALPFVTRVLFARISALLLEDYIHPNRDSSYPCTSSTTSLLRFVDVRW